MRNGMLLLVLCFQLSAFGRATKRAPESTPSPAAEASPSPSASPAQGPIPQGVLATIGKDTGSNVDRNFAQGALDELNRVVASGCVRTEFTKGSVTSLHNIDGKQVQTKIEAYERFVAGAPYALDLRWYSKFGKTVGYTYTYKDAAEKGPSETRIYSNTRMMGTKQDHAAHLAHELSHQARAGGFVHWTVHQGSTPYEIGNAVDRCLAVKR